MSANHSNKTPVWKISLPIWGLLLLAALFATALFHESVFLMVKWWEKEEYSHGYLIPPIVAFLIWQKKNELEKIRFDGSWIGVFVAVFSMLLFYAGELNAPYIVTQYGYLLALVGIALSLMGRQGTKVIWAPLLIMVFMVPLPNIIYRELSAELQLVSSQIGVAVIRLFDISVYLEGNVIDLGSYKLQVVEACSGLRYLFPLMTLGFIAAYFFQAAFWKRALIFISSLPITVLMNSFRIGLIGVTVEYWGPEMADGFLHDFEGWVVFMGCTAVLVLEMWVLAMVGKDRRPLREVFGLEFPDATPEGAVVTRRTIPTQLLVVLGILVAVLVASTQIDKKQEIIPDRPIFAEFPAQIGKWKGKRDQLERIYIDELKFDDYIMSDYTDGSGMPINFYVAYYGSQATGQSSHSPKNCLPGGGWQIKSSSTRKIPGVMVDGIPLVVNRYLIRKEEATQLVYYWFQGRGRITTNEYFVKWYLFWDALTKQRTDGALVRLTVYVPPGEDVALADARLQSFAEEIERVLPQYIPD